MKGNFNLGTVENEYLVGVDKTWYTYALSNNAAWNGGLGKWTGTGNLYQANHWPSLPRPSYDPAHNQDAQMTGWHVVDTLKALDDKLVVTLGLHGHKVKKVMKDNSHQDSDAICPTFAASYKISDSVTVYADHTESFGTGSMVSLGKGYANEGQMLDPAKTKQNEIGVKVKTGDFLNTFTAFKITQANNIDKKLVALNILYRMASRKIKALNGLLPVNWLKMGFDWWRYVSGCQRLQRQ